MEKIRKIKKLIKKQHNTPYKKITTKDRRKITKKIYSNIK